jgi:hypothetical protein
MLAELKAKLVEARTYCINKNNSEPKPSSMTQQEWTEKKKASEKIYKDFFLELDDAIDNYSGKSSYDILWRLMSGLVMLHMMNNDPAPDLWQYYGASDSFSELMAKDNAYFYNGVLDEGEKPTFLLYVDKIDNAASGAEASRAAAAMSFIQPMLNEIPRLMFSDYTMPTISRTKQENAQFVYGDAHAAEIIRDMNINMLIPEGF